MKAFIQKQVNKLSLIIGMLVLCAAVFGNEVSEAATYYVATTGSDANPGTPAAPFRTIGIAYGKALPGDTIIVKSGVYTGSGKNYGFDFGKKASALLPITIKSETKWGAVLDDRNNKNHTSAAIILYGSYNILDGFEITNAYHDGIRVEGYNNKIINNYIHDNGQDPATSGGGSGIFSATYASGNLYIGNYLHRNGNGSGGGNSGHGLYLAGDNEAVFNNIITSNRAYGLQIAGYETVTNLKIYNNVFAYNERAGIILWKALDRIDIKNNIFYNNKVFGIDSYYSSGRGVVFDRNMFYKNGSGTIRHPADSTYSYTQTNVYVSDPLFVSDTDFRLQPTSPAIDRGTTITEVSIDLNGLPRPQGTSYDIGAYEFVELVQNPAPPSNLTLTTSP